MANKLRVGVLMGGKSVEHEVSFNSGRTVGDHLDTVCYEIVPLYMTKEGCLYILPWHFLHRGKTSDFVGRLATEAQKIEFDDLKNIVDFIYLTMHGRYAEDGTIQGFLEILGIPYLGSGVFASALAMDKIIQKNVLAHAGITVPRGIHVYGDRVRNYSNNEKLLELISEAGLKFPLIVKPSGEGSSVGVSVVSDASILYKAITEAACVNNFERQSVLIEEKVKGMEFSCIVIQDQQGTFTALPPTEIEQSNEHDIFDYEQKYMPGMAVEHTPARCSQEILQKIQRTCVQVTKILGITTISRVDGFLLSDGTVTIFEANTISGMGPASLLFRAAAEIGMSHTTLINYLIKTELSCYGLLCANQEGTAMQNDVSIIEQKKRRVVVLLGGNTHEKEISLESGRNVVYKLSPQKYDVIPVFVTSTMDLYRISQSLLVRNSTAEIESLVDPSQKLKWADLHFYADFVFIGLHGGLGENGAVQGTLELLGIPYNGSGVLPSALCMDKYKTNEYLRGCEIDVPRSVFIRRGEWFSDKKKCMSQILTKIGIPVIIKPHDDGCSVMVSKVTNENDIAKAVEIIFEDGKSHVLVEECIIGTELTVGVIGNDVPMALPPSQVVVSGDILSIEEKFLPGAGENQTPALIGSQAIKTVQSVMEKAYRLVGCKGYVRIDCFYQNAQQSPTGKERVIIIEINTLPGLTPATCIFHQAAEIGIKPMDFIDLIVQLGFQNHVRKLVDDSAEYVDLKDMIAQISVNISQNL